MDFFALKIRLVKFEPVVVEIVQLQCDLFQPNQTSLSCEQFRVMAKMPLSNSVETGNTHTHLNQKKFT